jgi:hypothetical protein
MNRIIERLRQLRLGTRHRRVEMLGGHPAQEPEIEIERFAPELSEASRTQAVRDKVSQLGAASFDDVTGNALAPLIAIEGEGWSHQLDEQHKAWQTRAGQSLDKSYAVAWQYRQLLDEDLMRLRHAEIAVETAVLGLSGQDPDEPDALSAVIKVVPERSAGQAGQVRAVAAESVPPAEPAPPPVAEGSAEGDPAELEMLDCAMVLRPPQVSRSELRPLFDPQDASRVPRWGEQGFRDGTLLAGRPASTFVHILALVLAAGADIGAFTQTVQLVLPQSGWVALMVVFGLTAVVLYLAHSVGVILRDAKAASRYPGTHGNGRRRPTGRRLAATCCTVIWLGVGGLAFWVRYTVPLVVPPPVGGCGGVIGAGPGGGCSNGTTSQHPLQAAAIFFGLYLATGAVAAVGAYITHNPYRGGYMSAIQAYRKASEHAAASMHRFGLARAACLNQAKEIEVSDQVLADAQARNKDFTGKLKQIALIEIASLLKDPAVTDAYFPGT